MAIFASFARYVFRTFIFKATIIILYYVSPQWLFIELPIYCQRENCNPGILVSRKVRFMYIFAGVCQMRVGWSQMAIFASFARYIFGTFTFKAIIIILCYVSLYFSGSSLTPKPMTLNGHFPLKSGPNSASNGLAFWLSAKTILKFAELRI